MASADATQSGSNTNPEGAAGQAMFADMGELTVYLGAWKNEVDSIMEDGAGLQAVAGGVQSPTGDAVTTEYFAALSQALVGFADHNGMISDYTGAYVQKLAASRDAMSTVEQTNTSTLSTRPGQ